MNVGFVDLSNVHELYFHREQKHAVVVQLDGSTMSGELSFPDLLYIVVLLDLTTPPTIVTAQFPEAGFHTPERFDHYAPAVE